MSASKIITIYALEQSAIKQFSFSDYCVQVMKHLWNLVFW